MDSIVNTLINMFSNIVSQLQFLLRAEYYMRLLESFASLSGLVVGGAFVLIVWCACDKEVLIPDFIRIIAAIAVITSSQTILRFLHQHGIVIWFLKGDAIGTQQDNIISGILLTLVIMESFRHTGIRAFFFGIASQAALPMLYYNYYSNVDYTYLVIRILLIGLLCWLMSTMEHFSTGVIVYFVFHIGIRLAADYLPIFGKHFESFSQWWTYVQSTVGENLQYYLPDIVIFVIVLSVSLLLERVVLKTGRVITS